MQVKALRVQKLAKFGELKEQVEAELGVAVPLQRYWMWARRQNHTYRPSKYLTPVEDTKTLQEIKESAKSHVRGFGDNERDVKLYLEENLDAEGRPQPLPAIGRGDTLLFFKFYDAARGEIRFVGKTFVHLDRKFTELKDHMCAMAGLPPDEEIRLFEVSSRVACAPCGVCSDEFCESPNNTDSGGRGSHAAVSPRPPRSASITRTGGLHFGRMPRSSNHAG